MGGSISFRRRSPVSPISVEAANRSPPPPLNEEAPSPVPHLEDAADNSSPQVSRPALLSRKSSTSVSYRTRTFQQLEEHAESLLGPVSPSGRIVSLSPLFEIRWHGLESRRGEECSEHSSRESSVPGPEDERHGPDHSPDISLPHLRDGDHSPRIQQGRGPRDAADHLRTHGERQESAGEAKVVQFASVNGSLTELAHRDIITSSSRHSHIIVGRQGLTALIR